MPRPARRRRSPRAVASTPSGGAALGRALLGEELGVQLERVVELLRHLVLGEDRIDGACLDAGVAVDADRRVDVELLSGLEVRGAWLGVDAVDRTDFDARVVLDAAANDHVGHTPQTTKRWLLPAAARDVGAMRDGAGRHESA